MHLGSTLAYGWSNIQRDLSKTETGMPESTQLCGMSLGAGISKFSSSVAFRILLHAGFWVLYLSSPLYTYISTGSFGPEGIAVFAVINLAFLPFYYFLAYFLIPRFFNSHKIGWFILSVLVLYLVFILTVHGLETICLPYLKTEAEISIYTRALQRSIFYLPELLQMSIVTTIPLAIKSQRRYYKLRQQQAALEQMNTDLELNFLKSQLHPHFLFNTLNNIYSLTLQGSDRSPEMILKLSDLMRYMLYECNVPEADLQKDIQFLQDYIDLEKLRHGNDAEILFSVEGEVQGKKIPPLLLIPFVENAFKHGINAQLGKAWVSIHIKITSSGGLIFTVENNKPHHPENTSGRSGGIGIENARKRLSLLYSGHHNLLIADQGNKFMVNLTIDAL